MGYNYAMKNMPVESFGKREKSFLDIVSETNTKYLMRIQALIIFYTSAYGLWHAYCSILGERMMIFP